MTQREQLRAEVGGLEQQRRVLATDLQALQEQLIATKDEVVLQEVGIYEYSHPLDSALAYQQEKDRIVEQIKAMAKGKQAITSATDWTVNGSAAQGRKMVNDFSKLITSVRSMRKPLSRMSGGRASGSVKR